jgi:hypothetical protein
MSTDLAVQEPATEPVADVADDLHLIARSPAEMATAQKSLAVWCDAKIAILQKDADELGQGAEIARKHKWRAGVLEKHHVVAVKRIEFYEKVKAAVEAGYCVIPNFPVEVFAIRTCLAKPRPKKDRNIFDNKRQSSESPPLGEGEHQDPLPIIHERRLPDKLDSAGNPKVVHEYFARAFEEEIDFPLSVARPEIMSATVEAMALRCFDELGVLPGRKAKRGDPLVVGIIRDHSKRYYDDQSVSFLIAWYVDTRAI